MVRAIITDLDGTLLGADARVSAANAAALRRAVQAGCALVVATGRSHDFVVDIQAQLALPVVVISANGARVHAPDGQLLAAANLAPPLARALLQPALRQQASEVAAYLDHERLAARCDDRALQWYGSARQVPDFADFGGEGVAKVVYCGSAPQLAALEQDIRSRYAGQLSLTYSQDCYLEAMAPGVSKGSALQQVLAQLDIAAADCVAFGDALNDAEMLALVGHPHLMANASPALCARLPHAARAGHHDESAVAAALARWF